MADEESGGSSFIEEFRKGKEDVQRKLDGNSTTEVSLQREALEEIVRNAKSDTVTVDRLVGEEQYFHNVIPFFEEGEQPHFVFPLTQGLLADSPLVVESGAEREELLSKTDGGSVVITDRYVRVQSSKGEWTIPYNSISSVDFVGHPALHIQTAGRTYYIKIAGTFFDEDENLSEAASYIREQQRQSKQESTSESDPLEKLEKLGELRDKGVLSDAEFEEKKQELMDQI